MLLEAHEELCSVLVQDVLLAAAATMQARTVEVAHHFIRCPSWSDL